MTLPQFKKNLDGLIQNIQPLPTITKSNESAKFQEFSPLSESIAPPLPVDCLPAWLSDFCRELSISTQTPVDMALMVSLPILATALQGKFVVSPLGGSYCEPLNIWTLVSMPPGSRKTAIMSALREPLVEWEKEQARKLKPLVLEDEAKRVVSKRRLSDLQVQAAKESDNSELMKQIAELQMQLDAKPIQPPRLWTGDVTAEELQNMLAEHQEKMSLLADEGGIFEVMTGMYNDGKVNIDVFLQAWSGSPARINRGSREVILDKPVLSFGLTVQPEILSSLAKGNKKKLKGIGALARFLYAVPESNIGNRNVRLAKEVDPGCKRVYDYNVKALLDLNPSEPIKLILSETAKDSYHDFAQFVEDRQGLGREFEDIQDWTAKLPGQALRLAGLFHVAENWTNSTTISDTHMIAAIRLCTALIDHAKVAFSQMEISQATADAKFIVFYLLNKSEIPRRELQRLGRFSKSPAERLNKALAELEERGYLALSHTGHGKTILAINPEVANTPYLR
jgi:putative DNA primase/helicase